MKNLLIIIFISFIICDVYSQNEKVDSLLKIYESSKIDTVKILALKDIALQLYLNSPSEAEKYCLQCLELSEEIDFYQGLIRCNNILGIIKTFEPDYVSAIEKFNISMEKAEEINDEMSIFRASNNLGSVYVNISDYSKAVGCYTKSLAIAEKLNDTLSIAKSYMNIAVIHKDNSDLEKAMEYNNKALELAIAIDDQMLQGQIYGNISNVKSLNGNYLEAIDYSRKSLEIQKKLDYKIGIGIAYINLGEYYLNLYKTDTLSEYTSALDSSRFYYQNALVIGLEIEDEQRISNAKSGIGKIYLFTEKYDSAKFYFNQVVDISKKNGVIESTMEAYFYLSAVDSALGNYNNALQNFKLYKLYSDSVFTDENINAISEMEIKYQTEKKQQEIENLKKEQQLQTTKNRLLILGIFLLIILFAISLIAFINKRKDNRLLKLKNAEIHQQKEEIQTQADNLEVANSEILLQKQHIELSHKNMTNSIIYAKRIQSAVLPDIRKVNSIFSDNFILYKPKDIVSGDFYFFKRIKNYNIVAVADCTGHGVPGAFMSMLGMTLLNEIIIHKETIKSNQVLDELRNQLKVSLQQTGQSGEQQDGMDIAFCTINLENLEMSFSGAHNPCWIFRNPEDFKNPQGFQLFELQADHQPVGVYLKEIPFTEQKIQLRKNDVFYIFSDGFTDQFGQEKKSKFKTRRFKDILVSVYKEDLIKQKETLEQKFAEWKGNQEQTDDVLVIGVKI